MNRLNTTEYAVFLYCRFSLFLKDPFFQIIKRSQQLSLFRVELVNFLPVHQYRRSVDIFFHIFVLQEYWVLTEGRIPLKPVLRGVTIVALFISSHAQTQCTRVCCFLIL